jgi:hypothetical protein
MGITAGLAASFMSFRSRANFNRRINLSVLNSLSASKLELPSPSPSSIWPQNGNGSHP